MRHCRPRFLSALQTTPPLLPSGKGSKETQVPATENRSPIEIIGSSEPMQQVFTTLNKVANTQANILLLGENGNGERIDCQGVASGFFIWRIVPFVHVDLGAISESLFESELFGHVKGSFTDAREDRMGRFEAAHGGTPFPR